MASDSRPGSRRRREHAGVADDGRRAGVPEHAASPAGAARRALGRSCARPDRDLSDGPDPEQEALLADSVGLALLVVLEALSPAERLAFVLHDVFGVPFSEIATVLERSEAAAMQLASRARRRVQSSPVPDRDLPRQQVVVDAFFAAARDGDFDALVRSSTPTSSSGSTAAGYAVRLPSSFTVPKRLRRTQPHLLEAPPLCRAGARERSRGSHHRASGQALCRHGIRRRRREDRGD